MHFALEVEAVARQGQAIRFVDGYDFIARADHAHRAGPRKRMRIRMAGCFDKRQREDLAGQRFELGGQGRIHALRADLGFDHRHRGRQAVTRQDLLLQHFGRQRPARQFGARRKTIGIDVRHQHAPATLGGDIRHRQIGQLQGGLQEADRLQDPAILVQRRQRARRERTERKAAPCRQCDRIKRIAGTILQTEQTAAMLRQQLQRFELGPVGQGGDFEVEQRGIAGKHRQPLGTRHRQPAHAERSGVLPVDDKAEGIKDGDAHATGDLLSQPGRQRRVVDTGIEPADDAGVATGEYAGRQRLRRQIEQFVAQAEVIERHPEKALRRGVMKIQVEVIDQHQHRARQDFDIANAQRHQPAIGDPRNEAVADELACRAACQRARAGNRRIDIIDRDDRQFIALAYGLHLRHQPGPVGRWHRTVLLAGRIVTLIQRLGGDREDQRCDLGQQLETPVEDQPRVGITALEFAQQGHHRLLLARAPGIGSGKQLIGVERVEEEAAPALLPQGGNHASKKKFIPAGCGLVDDLAAPGGIVTAQRTGRQRLVVGTGRLHFAQRDIRKQFMRAVGRGTGMAGRIADKVRLDHGDIEGLQIGQWRLRAVVKRYAWCRCQHQHRQAQDKQAELAGPMGDTMDYAAKAMIRQLRFSPGCAANTVTSGTRQITPARQGREIDMDQFCISDVTVPESLREQKGKSLPYRCNCCQNETTFF
ncbi:hypothetical protein IMCC9480_2093 [Oxalobacteraceae bacterium IMCC9480]|nr:hypothetical protein IMCC9480_2093 [Oxalobacteraceae bacterium IMCC9480]